MSLGNDALPIQRSELQLPQPDSRTPSTFELGWANFKQTWCVPQQLPSIASKTLLAAKVCCLH